MKVRYLGKTYGNFPLQADADGFLGMVQGECCHCLGRDKLSGWYRVIDTSGEDWLYPPEFFEIVPDTGDMGELDMEHAIRSFTGKYAFLRNDYLQQRMPLLSGQKQVCMTREDAAKILSLVQACPLDWIGRSDGFMRYDPSLAEILRSLTMEDYVYHSYDAYNAPWGENCIVFQRKRPSPRTANTASGWLTIQIRLYVSDLEGSTVCAFAVTERNEGEPYEEEK